MTKQLDRTRGLPPRNSSPNNRATEAPMKMTTMVKDSYTKCCYILHMGEVRKYEYIFFPEEISTAE